MNHNNPHSIVLMLVLSTACSDEPTSHSSRADATSAELAPAPTRATARYEVDFMTDMIDHHAMAVEMAELCLEKAVHADLLAMCGDIIAAQSAEIETLQSWLLDWYGLSHEPAMSTSGQKRMAKLSTLEGADFEIAFMEMMIKHHRGAVKEGERCTDKAYHAPLIELCENIVVTQATEIVTLEQWLCAWYGRC